MYPYTQCVDGCMFVCAGARASDNEDNQTIRTEDFVDKFQDTMVYSSGTHSLYYGYSVLILLCILLIPGTWLVDEKLWLLWLTVLKREVWLHFRSGLE